MKSNILAASALLLLLTACEDKIGDGLAQACPGDCTVVTGQLLTNNYTRPLIGGDIMVQWVGPNTGLGGIAITKAKGKTDLDGKYRLSFLVRDNELKDGYFRVLYDINKKSYYVRENALDLRIRRRDTMAQLAPYLVPRKAFIKLNITNQPELAATKASASGTRFESMFNFNYGFRRPATQPVMGNGEAIDWVTLPADRTTEVPANQPIIVRSLKVKAGLQTATTDTLYVGDAATETFTVTY